MVLEKEEWQAALIAKHGAALREAFSTAKVAVCGLGGLGSHVAAALARAGIGKLILTDFDRVDISNLHRQQYKAAQVGMFKTEATLANIREIAPFADMEIHTVRLARENAKEILREADIICEAFDDAVEKAALVNFVLCEMPEKYIVAASGMAGISSPNRIRTRHVAKHFYLCGDEESDIANFGALICPRVMLCAAHQAHTVLRILANEFGV